MMQSKMKKMQKILQKKKVLNFTRLTIMAVFFILFFILKAESKVTLSIESAAGFPDSSQNEVVISLDNSDDSVKGIQADIIDEGDYLTISVDGEGNPICETTGRASGFTCEIIEFEDGTARFLMVITSGGVITQGQGEIAILKYDVAEDVPSGDCKELRLEDVVVSDEDIQTLDVEVENGEFCFDDYGITPDSHDYGDGDDDNGGIFGCGCNYTSNAASFNSSDRPVLVLSSIISQIITLLIPFFIFSLVKFVRQFILKL